MLTPLRSIVAVSVALLVLLVPASPASAGACVGALSTVPGAATNGAQVGAAIGIAGTDVLVGAPGQGTVYTYRRSALGGYAAVAGPVRPAALLVSSAFGTDIAVDGTVAAVGAPFHNSLQGAVVLYSRASNGTWSVLQTINSPIDLPNGCFGFSVAMHGGFLAVGAPAAINAAGFARGVVYLYVRDPSGTYSYLARLDPNEPAAAQDKFFGWSVGLANSILSVSAPGEQLATDGGKEGSAYVYRRAGTGAWEALIRLKSADAAGGTYGTDLAVGTQEADGSGVSIFVREQRPLTTDAIWQYRMGIALPALANATTATASPAFGGAPQTDVVLTNTMAIHEGVGLVGAPSYSGAGSRVDEYVHGGGTWSYLTSITGPAGSGTGFGQGVGIGHNQFAVGAPDYEPVLNLMTGYVAIGTHADPDCNVDGTTDACAIAVAGQAVLDVDLDGIPDGCELVGTPVSAVATGGTLSTGIGITWPAVLNAATYQVSLVNGDDETLVATTYAAQCLDTTAAAGTILTYRVRAVSPDGTVSAGFAACSGWRKLAAPTGIAATDGASVASVTVTWDAVEGATAYKVLRSAGGVSTTLATVADLSYVDTTATAGVLYAYTVQATCEISDSVVGTPNTGYRAANNAPLTVSATDGTSVSSVTVTWTAPEGSTNGFTILRGLGAATPRIIGTAGAAIRTFTDASVPAAGKLYRYYVRPAGTTSGARFDTGWKAARGPATLAAAEGTSTTGIALSWPAPPGATKATGFILYRSVGGGALAAIKTLPKTARSYTDATALPGITYTYSLRCTSPFGLTFPVTDTGWRGLGAPTGFAASDNLTDMVSMAWNNTSGATGYQVTRVGPSGTTTFNTVANLYLDTTAEVGVTYTYSVKATCALGMSAASATNTGIRVAGFRLVAAPGAGGTAGAAGTGASGARSADGRPGTSDAGAADDDSIERFGPHTWLVDGIKLEAGLFVMGARDRMVVALRDPGSAQDASMLVVTGDASLAGELVVAFDGYEPKAGDRWTIVLAGRLDGDFRAVHAPALPEGLRLEAVPMGATFEVRVVAIEE
jgi:hypothetical protein